MLTKRTAHVYEVTMRHHIHLASHKRSRHSSPQGEVQDFEVGEIVFCLAECATKLVQECATVGKLDGAHIIELCGPPTHECASTVVRRPVLDVQAICFIYNTRPYILHNRLIEVEVELHLLDIEGGGERNQEEDFIVVR